MTLLSTEEDLEVVAQADSGHDAISLTAKLQPDVILMDVRMPISNSSSHILNQLSSRELEILRLVGQGKNNQEIAQDLHLSIGTVKNYITQILSKLAARDRIAAALLAQRCLLA